MQPYAALSDKQHKSDKMRHRRQKGQIMEIHELNDFPYEYVTRDESDKTDKTVPATHFWQNDPNHNVEPKSDESDNSVTEHVCGANCTTTTCDVKFTEHYGYPRRHGRNPRKSDESDKPTNREPEYKSVLRDESDKRVMRFFIGQQGMIWIVWEIVDIPAGTDDPDYSHLLAENGWGLPTSDGKLAMVTAHPFLTRKQADEFAAEGIRFNTQYDDEILTHTYDLAQM